MPRTKKSQWQAPCFFAVAAVAGILGFSTVANADNTHCCLYYFGNKGNACAAYDLSSKTLVELGDEKKSVKTFLCSQYDSIGGKELECQNGIVNTEEAISCINSGQTVFQTTLAGAKKLDFSQYNSIYGAIDVKKQGDALCLALDGFTAEIVTVSDPLCAVGVSVTDNPINNTLNFKYEYNAAYQKQITGIDPKLKQDIQKFKDNTCCVPRDPANKQCVISHIKSEYDFALSGMPIPKLQEKKVNTILLDLKKQIQDKTLKLDSIFACDADDSNTKYSFYAIPCDSNTAIDLPSDKYEGDKYTNKYISDYCGNFKYNSSDVSGPSLYVPDVSELNKLGTVDAKILIGRIIQTLLGVIGSISLAMFVYGGILLMTDTGNSERAGQAKKIFVWNALGLAVIFSSYALVKMIFEAFS